MSTYGRTILNKTGRDVMVLADLQDAQFKVGGITLDWSTFTAAPADAVLAGQQPVKAGDKVVRFGQVLCEITASGKYGPYDPEASDGRQTLTRGKCFVANRTTFENGYGVTLNNGVTDHPQVFDGGTAWKPRLIITTGTQTLAAGPTIAEFEAAFPRIAYAG